MLHEDFGFAAPEAIADASGVWRDEEIFRGPERALGWNRLGCGDVDGGAADLSGVERVGEGVFVEDCAAAPVMLGCRPPA